MKLQKGPTPPPLIHIPHNYEVYASDLFHIRLFLYFFTDILPYSALFFKGQTMPLAVGRATAHAFSPLPLILQAFPHPVACFWNAAARRKIPPRRYTLLHTIHGLSGCRSYRSRDVGSFPPLKAQHCFPCRRQRRLLFSDNKIQSQFIKFYVKSKFSNCFFFLPIFSARDRSPTKYPVNSRQTSKTEAHQNPPRTAMYNGCARQNRDRR